MATIKVVLRKNIKEDGTYPLVIRITKDRKTNFVYLGHSVKLKDWDASAQRVKKSHPNSVRLNNLLIKKLAEAEDKRIEMEANKTDTSSKTIRKSIVAAKDGTFFKQAEVYTKLLEKQGKYNMLSADKPRIERFREYIGGDIVFADITVELLKDFQAWLKNTRTISQRTIVNYLVVIRSIFSQAISASVAEKKDYPFGKGKIAIKFPDTNKIGISPEDIKKLEEIELQTGEHHARNLWLFAFYLAGVRMSDVLRLKWSDIQNDRLYYTMGKNNKPGSLKLPIKAVAIIEQYRRDDPNHNLIFPDLEGLDDLSDTYNTQKRIKTRIKSANEYLQSISKKAGIHKTITTHISRHTFGNLSGDKIPIQMLQKLYRHSSITTTIGYQQNFIHKDADEALDAVISF